MSLMWIVQLCFPGIVYIKAVLSKMKGKLARVATILHAMQQACRMATRMRLSDTDTTEEAAVEAWQHFVEEQPGTVPSQGDSGIRYISNPFVGMLGDLRNFRCKYDVQCVEAANSKSVL